MSGLGKINCESARELLDSFHDNELSNEERGRVESHLDQCSGCSEALEEISSVSGLLRAIPRQELEKDFADDLASRVYDSPASIGEAAPAAVASLDEARAKARNKAFFYVAAVAACLMALIVSVPRFLGGDQPGSGPVVAEKDRESGQSPVVATGKDKAGDAQQKATLPVVAQKDTVLDGSTPKKEKEEAPAKLAKQAEAEKLPVPVKPEEAAPLVAVNPTKAPPAVPVEQDDLLSTEAVVAYDGDEPDGLFSQMGIGTDEDGLYAIKL